jgi:apolipoprotein N-acyltransferase
MADVEAGRFSTGIVAALATGVLYALSRDIGPVGPLAFVAPIPLLLFAMRSGRALHVAVCALAARVVSLAAVIYAYGGTIPYGVLAAATLLFSIEFVVVVSLTRWSVRRLPTWASVFAFPMLTTASEFLFLMFAPNGSFGSLGYSLVDVLLFAQAASVGGVPALTFIAALVPSALAVGFLHPMRWRTAAFAGAAPLLVFAIFGAWRLAQPYEQSVRVGLASIDQLTAQAWNSPEQARVVAERYAALVRGFSKGEVDIVVLPERVFADVEAQVGSGSEPLQNAARDLKATVVAGFNETLPSNERGANTARVFSPDGKVERYIKRKLIPGLESDLVPGKESLLMGKLGVAICKDLDFAPMIREYGRAGVNLLLVPAWDFKVDGRMHSRMAVVRGIENGFAMARAAAGGKLTVSDAYGRIVAEKTTSEEQAVMLSAEIGLTSSGTIYSKLGDVFAWLCVFAAIFILSAATLRQRFARRASHGSEALAA